MKKKKPVWSWTDAVAKADVPPLTKAVCWNIARYLSDAGKGWVISIEEMMADTGLGNQALAKHIANAVEAKLLVVTRLHDKHGHRSGTSYAPRFPDDVELSREPADMGGGSQKGATVTPLAGRKRAALAQSDAGSSAKKGATVTPFEGHGPSVRGTSGLRLRLRVRRTSRPPSPSVRGTSDLSVRGTRQYKATFPDSTSPSSNPPLFPSLPEKNDRPDCVFEDGQIVLRNGLRSFWLDKFGGDAERLDLGLITAAAYVQPNSMRPIEAQVSAQLARQLAEKRDRDQRYAKAASSRQDHGEARVDSARAFLARAGIPAKEIAR